MRDTQRLDKILANAGYGTRKEIKMMVKDGLVKVDGETVSDSGMHVNPVKSIIEVCGEILKYKQFIYVMMNKPKGVISATYDSRLRTVVDILPDEFKCFNLFPVGRLDIDTEGLLLMTNDGQIAHELLSPKKHVPKKYYAVINENVSESIVEKFREGVELDDGYKTMPADLHVISPGENPKVEIIIHEGKFHQVKRMFEAVGRKVTYLKRIEMGPLKLDDNLKPGECRELTEEEIEMLKTRTI